MKTCLLWFDNSKTRLEVKIQKAVEYYERKYGRKPNLSLVHPSMMPDEAKRVIEMSGLTVRAYRPVLPGHVWIGIADDGD